MDFDILRQTLEVTLDEVAFKKDDNDEDVSILSKAESNLKAYLDDQTSITDDEKARRYAEFLTNTITSVVTQAISIAGDAPLRDAQIATEQQKIASMQNEDAINSAQSNKDLQVKDAQIAVEQQKVISMQNEDKARANEVAAKVAKTKFEIETLLPAQVATENKKLELMSAQVQTELKKLEMMGKEISLKDKDLSLKDKEINIKEIMAQVEAEKVPLMRYQAANERIKAQLTKQQIGVAAMEVQYKLAQIKAIQDAAQLNKEIEHEKNETQLKVAELYALR